MNLADNLKARRELEKLSMNELAKRVGTTHSMISYIESGTKIPGIGLLNKIAKVLDCSMDELVNGTSLGWHRLP